MRTFASWPLAAEQDVVAARQRARTIAERVGFDRHDQVRIATAVSEVARSAIGAGRRGRVEFGVDGAHVPQRLVIAVHGADDAGDAGRGIDGARRLVDRSDVREAADGRTVTLHKLLPAKAGVLDEDALAALQRDVAGERAGSALEELQQQHHDLLHALAEVRERQEQLEHLNRELEDTNRGVVALYAELDQKADHLRRADETKSRFLSNMSHEFRTPLNSIRALCGLLLDRVDGPLTDEQEKQVGLVRKSADDLAALVEDLLDLAKIEAGRVEVHAAEVNVEHLFSALRGMMRPLLQGDAVALRFEAPANVPTLWTDEAKLSQILRNFVSNALKYTERGEVVVDAVVAPDGREITFRVRDTGIGIAPDDVEQIFEEFVQVRHALQRRVKGTGLGLPLCRRLAACLGGTVFVASEPGVGSTFHLRLPVRHAEAGPSAHAEDRASWRIPVMVVDEDADALRLADGALADTVYRPVGAASVHEARERLPHEGPAALVLGVHAAGDPAWSWLAELKRRPETERLPVIVVSEPGDAARGLALGADASVVRPGGRGALVAALDRAIGARVLVVDDDAGTRYTLRRQLATARCYAIDAPDAAAGLAAARELAPAAIVLDLGLPDRDGTEALAELRSDPATRDIPVIVATTRDLTAAEYALLGEQAQAVLSKRELGEQLVPLVARMLDRAKEGGAS